MENKQQTSTIIAQPNSFDLAQPQYTGLSLAIADLQVEALETRLSMMFCDIPTCNRIMEHTGQHNFNLAEYRLK